MSIAAILRAWFGWRERHRRTIERAMRDARIARDRDALKTCSKYDPRRGRVLDELRRDLHARMRESLQ
jgi:Flp pilus assembly protein TadB